MSNIQIEKDQSDTFYTEKTHNRSFHSNLAKLNQKLKKANSLTHNDECDKQLRRCSDFSRLNIEEEYVETYEKKTATGTTTTTIRRRATRLRQPLRPRHQARLR